MKGFVAFFKKEALESFRTYRLLVVLAVFAVLGVLSPVAAKMMPEILNTVPLEGMTLILPTPTALDAWAQFFKNLSQMGLVVFLLVLSGLYSTEYAKGTLVNLLTKGLSRSAVALAKAAWAAVLWTVAYALTLGLSMGYTAYLFPGEAVENLIPAVAGLWLFGLLLVACLLAGGSMLPSAYGGLLCVLGLFIALSLMDLVPFVSRFNPRALAAQGMGLLQGQTDPSTLVWPFALTALATLGLIGLSVVGLRRRPLG